MVSLATFFEYIDRTQDVKNLPTTRSHKTRYSRGTIKRDWNKSLFDMVLPFPAFSRYRNNSELPSIPSFLNREQMIIKAPQNPCQSNLLFEVKKLTGAKYGAQPVSLNIYQIKARKDSSHTSKAQPFSDLFSRDFRPPRSKASNKAPRWSGQDTS